MTQYSQGKEALPMQVVRSHERASREGPAQWFTGSVWIDEIAKSPEPSRIRFFWMNFAPCARTAWHTHPFGQIIHVIAGNGLVQLECESVQPIHPGDTVAIAPGERHWHGAAPDSALVHLVLQEADDQGVDVVWFEHVSDEEYAMR